MDNIIISASMTLEKSISTKRYKWKSDKKKESLYKIPYRRAFVRFSCKNFAQGLNNIKKEKRQILIKFLGDSEILITRVKNRGISLQGYVGKHPYVQMIINRILPPSIKEIFENSDKKTLTLPINVNLNLGDWKDIGLSPEDFLLEVEKDAKVLMKKAIKKNFKINLISKGRAYDLGLINPNKKEMIIAISSHVAKNKSRSKEKTIQKILMDISKMLPYLDKNKEVVPIIVTRPLKFENSWSFSSHKYLDYYKRKFGFVFLTTEFKNNWEDSIIRELLKI